MIQVSKPGFQLSDFTFSAVRVLPVLLLYEIVNSVVIFRNLDLQVVDRTILKLLQ